MYDEIYISVYENTMINGKPYSLPLQEPVTNITMEDFAQACFSKGEGWHCLTAAEWGLLADTSLKLGTLPHGNTNCSHRHGDDKEQGIIIEDSYKTLTGSGRLLGHDHTASGVHDLCGNIWGVCPWCENPRRGAVGGGEQRRSPARNGFDRVRRRMETDHGCGGPPAVCCGGR